MTWWQIILAALAFIALCLFLAIWAKASAYRRDAEEHGDHDA
ncbi:hypothetical protein [Achromobacter sp. NFACC18-2]|nr:hypothetical protein [Achromobacter sp. NFACC18-2]SEI78511.1 hypothetical protein SAMN03159494_00991 [Achromobacter sp. NFACC18-2]